VKYLSKRNVSMTACMISFLIVGGLYIAPSIKGTNTAKIRKPANEGQAFKEVIGADTPTSRALTDDSMGEVVVAGKVAHSRSVSVTSNDRKTVRKFIQSNANRSILLDDIRNTIHGVRVDALCEMLAQETDPEIVLRIVDVMKALQDSVPVSRALVAFFERDESWDALAPVDRRPLAVAKLESLSGLGLTQTEVAKSYLEDIVFGDKLETWRQQEAIGQEYDLSKSGVIGYVQGTAAFGLCLMESRGQRDRIQELRLKSIALVEGHGNPSIYDKALPDEVQSAVHFITTSSEGLAGFDMIEELGLDGYLRIRIEDADGFNKMMPYHMRHYHRMFSP